MEFIRDMFQVKRLERILGRRLTELEMSGEKAVKYRKEDGQMAYERIKKYNIRDFYTKNGRL